MNHHFEFPAPPLDTSGDPVIKVLLASQIDTTPSYDYSSQVETAVASAREEAIVSQSPIVGPFVRKLAKAMVNNALGIRGGA